MAPVAVDTAWRAGLVWDYMTLVAGPSPSCENARVRSLAWLLFL